MPSVEIQTAAPPKFSVGEVVFCVDRAIFNEVVVTGIFVCTKTDSWCYEIMWYEYEPCRVHVMERDLKFSEGVIITETTSQCWFPLPSQWAGIRSGEL